MSNATISRGVDVYSHDGAKLGQVGETRPHHFQLVNAEEEPVFGEAWLERSTIETAGIDRVVVGFVAEELKDFRTADPGASNVVPATSKHGAYIAGATPEEANELADPEAEQRQPPRAEPR